MFINLLLKLKCQYLTLYNGSENYFNKRGFEFFEGKITVKQIQGKGKIWFELSEGLRNQMFEKLGFYFLSV